MTKAITKSKPTEPSPKRWRTDLFSPLTVVRHRYEETKAEYEQCLKEQTWFEKSHWHSQTSWHSRGFHVYSFSTAIELSYPGPKYEVSYQAHHESAVVLRPRYWSKLLKRLGRNSNHFPPTLRNRKLVFDEIRSLDDYRSEANALKTSLRSTASLQKQILHREYLEKRTIASKTSYLTAKFEYDQMMSPILDARKDTRERKRLVETLQSKGFDCDGLPKGVPYKYLHNLAYSAYLGPVPNGLDLDGTYDYLRSTDRTLTLWAMERYPKNIRIERSNDPQWNKISIDIGSLR